MSLAFRHRLLGDQQPKQYGLSFDGVDDYTLTPLDFTSKTEVTLNFKVHVTQSPIDAVKGIVQFANTLAATAPLILVTRRDQVAPIFLQFYVSGAHRFPTTYVIGNEYFISVRRNAAAGTWAVFINSVLIGTYTGTLGPIANALGVYMGNGYGGYSAGIFKYLSVYDVALSDSEIQQIHSTGTSIINANRLLDVDFSTGSGTTLYDKTSNANHGTIYGATWVEL